MTLSRYLARRFLVAYLMVLGIFSMLMMLIGMVERVRKLAGTSAGFGQIAGLAALDVPDSVYRILPLIMILSAMMLFLSLARSSELVVIRAAGRSGLRMLIAPVFMAFLIGLFSVAVLNPLAAATQKRSAELAAKFTSGSYSVLSVSSEGLWLRQGGDGVQSVIRATRANEDATELFDVTFIASDESGTPLSRVEAASARLEPGAWALAGVKRWDLTAQNPEATAISQPQARVPSTLTVERIRNSFGDPSSISIWNLPAFITSLDQAGFSARAHRVWLQTELAMPFLMAGMVLLAAGFTMRHTRFGRTDIMVLLAVLTGFAMFFLRNFAQVLGTSGQIPIIAAAWVPPAATILAALGLLLHVEDG